MHVYSLVLDSFIFRFFAPSLNRVTFLSALFSYLNFFFFFFGHSVLGLSLVHILFPFASTRLGSSLAFTASAFAVSSFAASSSSPPGFENPALLMSTDSMVTVVYLSSSMYSSSWLMGSGSWKPVNSSSSSSAPDASESAEVSPRPMISPFACLTRRLTSSTCCSRSALRCWRSCHGVTTCDSRDFKTRTSFLKRSFSSLAVLAASSCANFCRATLRLWKPVRYSSRAEGSKSIFSVVVTFILRFFVGGGMAATAANPRVECGRLWLFVDAKFWIILQGYASRQD
jgi:hypothetical protein